MSARKRTPTVKSNSRLGTGSTPTVRNLNSSNSSRISSATRRNVRLELGETTINRRQNPEIKTSILAVPTVDYDLEFDLVLSDYYQALMKNLVIKDTIENHKREYQDQLASAQDLQHKTSKILHETRKNINTLELDSSITILEENIGKINENSVVLGQLKDLLDVLESKSREIHLRNITAPSDNYDELNKLIERLISETDKLINSGRDMKGIGRLSEIVKEFQQKHETMYKDIIDINENCTVGTFDIMQKLSDILYVNRSC